MQCFLSLRCSNRLPNSFETNWIKVNIQELKSIVRNWVHQNIGSSPITLWLLLFLYSSHRYGQQAHVESPSDALREVTTHGMTRCDLLHVSHIPCFCTTNSVCEGAEEHTGGRKDFRRALGSGLVRHKSYAVSGTLMTCLGPLVLFKGKVTATL